MLKTTFSQTATFLCVSAIVCATVSSAQTCQATVNGSYSYSAIGNGTPGAMLTPGASTVTPAFSNTGVGQLVGGATGTGPFVSSGTLYFDGSGNIRATSASLSGTVTAPVGTYVLNSDCTIAVTLTDGFGTNLTAATLQGVVLGSGSEIDLGVLQNMSDSTTAVGAIGVYQSNLLVKLVRPLATYCSASNLTGAYVLVATGTRVANIGTALIPVQTEVPFVLFGQVRFDGTGILTSPTAAPTSLGFLQFGGSYTVNTDCTGTITLTAVNPTGTTPTVVAGSMLSLSFILTQQDGSLPGSRPGIDFVLSSSSQILSGHGDAQ